MISTQSGSIRLFSVAGIKVSLHWSWLLVALYQISSRAGSYRSPIWMVAEYLALFAIVLLHEFGHAFATRQVGGESRDILLWPFGGIAFVKVPPRPGAELWSIAAGPLVNVLLWPVFLGLVWQLAPVVSGEKIWNPETLWSVRYMLPDTLRFAITLFMINTWLLIFNLMPIYPLDGGQILRSLLWFPFGRVRSLLIASTIGLIAIPLVAAYWIFWLGNGGLFTALMALFLGQQCLLGFKHARSLRALARLPKHQGFKCPTCHETPPGGPLWGCRNCGQHFDPFSTQATCPHCGTVKELVQCPNCGGQHTLPRWSTAPAGGHAPIIDV